MCECVCGWWVWACARARVCVRMYEGARARACVSVYVLLLLLLLYANEAGNKPIQRPRLSLMSDKWDVGSPSFHVCLYRTTFRH